MLVLPTSIIDKNKRKSAISTILKHTFIFYQAFFSLLSSLFPNSIFDHYILQYCLISDGVRMKLVAMKGQR
ncbi:MAG: hypothetical protein ACI8RD_008469 [Bacillariaceae sp.]|jgi:hypothetical protein